MRGCLGQPRCRSMHMYGAITHVHDLEQLTTILGVMSMSYRGVTGCSLIWLKNTQFEITKDHYGFLVRVVRPRGGRAGVHHRAGRWRGVVRVRRGTAYRLGGAGSPTADTTEVCGPDHRSEPANDTSTLLDPAVVDEIKEGRA